MSNEKLSSNTEEIQMKIKKDLSEANEGDIKPEIELEIEKEIGREIEKQIEEEKIKEKSNDTAKKVKENKKTKKEIGNKIMNFVRENIALILAFLVPVVILTCVFIGNEVFPFGDTIYLRSDCYHQYAPFYKELYRKLTEGGSLTYSWNIGMGVNFSALFAYYLASPINLLIGILAPTGNVLLLIDVLIIIKTGLCGFTMAYYLSKRFNSKSLSLIVAGLFYALSSYMTAFSWNIMWLDCLLLLPIIVLGIEKLVKEKKFLTYTIALGVAVFSNYYIAIMICIFSVLYFAVILFTAEVERNFKYYLGRIWLFGKYSIIAGGIGAAMFLPAYFALSYTASGEMNFPEVLSRYFSIIEMLSRSMMCVDLSIFNAHEPNLYCTIAVFLFVPLYCLSTKVNRREKIGKLMLIAILLVSFNLNIPNYIWHGLHFPNSLPARESFIYIFLLVTMAYEALINLKEFSTKQIGGCFAGAMALFLYIEEKYVSGDEYPFQIVYVSAFFLFLYFMIALAYKNGKLHKAVVTYLMIVVCIAEATISSTQDDAYNTTGYSYYLADNEAITSVLEDVKDTDFYRVEKLNRKTKNDAAWNDYHGVSIFSSTASSYFTDYLGYLGFEKSTNAYSYYGKTPFTSALLDVRYVISDSIMEPNENYTIVSSKPEDSVYLYRVNRVLSLGFMLPSYFDKLWEMSGNNPFAVQNSFAETATGLKNMYTQVDASSFGTTSTIDVKEDVDLYIYCTTYVENISYTAENAITGFTKTGNASGLKHRQIVHIGDIPAGSTVNVTTNSSDVASLQLYAYALHTNIMDKVLEELEDESFDVTEYNDTYIKGNITAKQDGVMYTSIIYDKGWKAYVDGKEVETSSIKGAMLTVPVTAGTHTVELKYTPDGFVAGWFITVSSVIILVCCALYDHKRRKMCMEAMESEETVEDIKA